MRRLLLLLFTVCMLQIKAQTTLDTAIDFSVKDITGYTHYLFDILDSGKLVVVDFFSTSCGPCATYAPQIQASYQHFGMNNGNVYFLGIAWGDDNIGVHQFDSTYGITFPTASGMQGNGNQVVLDYNIQSYPTVLLIMPNRVIQEKHIWPPTTAKIDSILIANGAIVMEYSSGEGQERISRPIIFPNPSKGQFNVQYSLAETSYVSYQLVDLSGRVLLSQEFGPQEPGIHHELLNASQLSKGMYLIHLKTSKTIQTFPVVLQ